MAIVKWHPYFLEQYKQLSELVGQSDLYHELFADITQLTDALSNQGHLIEGHETGDPSHPILASNFEMFALRRTPPTDYTPLATKPPILRIPYVWFTDTKTDTEFAVVMLIGDKTETGNDWYEPIVQQIETDLIPRWTKINPADKPKSKFH